MAEPEYKRRVYGRRQSRPLNKARKEAFDSLMPKLGIALGTDPDPALAPTTLFSSPKKEYWLEIGFGSGEHLAALMALHPENGYIGIEPYINGMAAFLKDIHQAPSLHGTSVQSTSPSKLEGHNKMDHTHKACDDELNYNVRVLMDDALLLCENLTDECLDGIYVLNPDPWPKTRHHKRRIISQENLDVFARILKPGGQLIMSTDVAALAEWMVTQSFTHPAFEWRAKRPDDWREPPQDWIKTRYEQKGADAGRHQIYLLFEKNE